MNEKLKVLQINEGNYGSTGNIMLDISKELEARNVDNYVAYANSRTNNLRIIKNSFKIGTIIERNSHILLSYLTGMNGQFSHFGTKLFLEKVKNLNPDIIHLHNLHNSYINLPMLFVYLKKSKAQIVWTLHDCWAFTGQCPHFTMVNCNKWKTGCYECPQYKKYPASRIDKTKQMYALKKEWFTGIENLTIVTPSEWLKGKVQQSFLSEYPVEVIRNGIDLTVFKPEKSTFRRQYNLEGKIYF